MNKLIVSAGLVAISAAALESSMADDVTGPKYWSVGATLRGFYDDNYDINANKKGSFGVELLPTVSLHVPLQSTDIGIRYTYGLYYYENRDELNVNPFDQTHQVDFWVDHAFSERWHGKVTDTFAVGQEPELLNKVGASYAVPYRINGNNIANHGGVSLDTDWTRLLSTSLSYANGYYDYQDHGAVVSSSGQVVDGSVPGPSLSGILDRDEESIALDLKWHVLPETTAFIGYQFAWVNYTGDEPIAEVFTASHPFGYTYRSSARDSRSHYIYVGVDQDIAQNLTASARVGATYTDVYNDPLYPSTSWSPYANLSVSYTYLPGSYVQLGVTHDISATDIVAPDSTGHLTQYSEASVVYLDLNHQITSRLMGTVIGRMEYDTYNGGADSNASTTDYGVGVNLTYQINMHFSVDAGYNYDDVTSDIANYGFSRNRVYLGLTATY